MVVRTQPGSRGSGHEISWFDQSPDGNRIMIESDDAGPPYLDRFATFTSQGVFERLLLETSFDGYNFVQPYRRSSGGFLPRR